MAMQCRGRLWRCQNECVLAVGETNDDVCPVGVGYMRMRREEQAMLASKLCHHDIDRAKHPNGNGPGRAVTIGESVTSACD